MSGSGIGVQRLEVKTEPTWLAEAEHVLISKGWKPPTKGAGRQSRSVSPVRNQQSAQSTQSQSSYKGKKNKLDSNFRPKKCYNCKCTHTENCNCPSVYHLAADFPNKKKEN